MYRILLLLFFSCIGNVLIAQTSFQQDVIKLVEQAKAAITKKDYATARRILEGSLVYGVYKDSIQYYIEVIDRYEGKYDHEGVLSKIGLKFVVQEGMCGYVNKQGEAVVPILYDYEAGDYNHISSYSHKTPQYSYVENWTEGTILVRIKKNGKYGLVDRRGILYVPPTTYDMIYTWSVKSFGELIRVRIGDRYGIINAVGEEVVPVQYKDVGESDFEGLSWVKRDDGKIAYVNFKGDFVTDFKYTYASKHFFGSFEAPKEYAQICKDGVWGFIDTKGNEFLFPQYDYVDWHIDNSGLVGVIKNKKLGFININKSIEEVIHPIYDVDNVSEIINRQGYLRSEFDDEVANVKKDGKWGLIDKNGNPLTKFIYDECDNPPHRYYKMNMPMSIAKIDGEERYLDFKGNEYRTKDELNQTSARVLLGAANEGNAAAMAWVSDCYKDGTCFEKDPIKAYEWCKKAVENGYISKLFDLGKMYYYGKGCPKSYAKAYETFMQAIQSNYYYCAKNAAYYVALMYEHGQVPNNFQSADDNQKAKSFYIKAAMKGNVESVEKFSDIRAVLNFASYMATGTLNNHEYVDLGLPSGLKWATCNVGASFPSNYGNYYTWGYNFPVSTNWRPGTDSYFTGMQDISGNSEYDAASKEWGKPWRMPTEEEIDELRDKCTWVWTNLEGHYGYQIIGPNSNSIFLPAAGRFQALGVLFKEERGSYWSSTPDDRSTNYALRLSFSESKHETKEDYRCMGSCIRPVTTK